MKRLNYLLLLCALILGPSAYAQAQSTQLSKKVIAQRCVFAQRYAANNLKEADLRARVDRLQVYQYVHQRLDLLAKRLEHNAQPGAKEYRANLNQYLDRVESFKDTYETYDDARESLSTLADCKNKPKEFNQALLKLRSSRKQVAKSISDINLFLERKTSTQLEILAEQFEGNALKEGQQ